MTHIQYKTTTCQRVYLTLKLMREPARCSSGFKGKFEEALTQAGRMLTRVYRHACHLAQVIWVFMNKKDLRYPEGSAMYRTIKQLRDKESCSSLEGAGTRPGFPLETPVVLPVHSVFPRVCCGHWFVHFPESV